MEEVAAAFGVHDVLTSSDWVLQLPVVARSGRFTLYQIPVPEHGELRKLSVPSRSRNLIRIQCRAADLFHRSRAAGQLDRILIDTSRAADKTWDVRGSQLRL